MHDSLFGLELIGLAGLYGLLFLAIEQLNARRAISNEFARKSTHMVGGVLAASLPLFLTRSWIIVFCLAFALIMLASKRWSILSSIHLTERKGYGEVWFPLGIALIAIVETNSDLRFACAALVLGLSDGLAGLIGKQFAHRRYQLVRGHAKSYLGSFTFFVVTMGILIGLFTQIVELPLADNLLRFAGISFALTVVEALSSHGLDNVVLPLITVIILKLANI